MKHFYVFVLLLYNFLTYSQNNIYKKIGLNEGLPSTQVYDIYQSQEGLLWFATDRGLANYNGYEVKSFGISDGIINNVVLDFHPQSDKTIFCSTLNSKLFFFEDHFQGFTPYPYNHLIEQYLSPDILITNIYKDKDLSLYISFDLLLGQLVISNDGKIIEEPQKINTEKKEESVFYFNIDTNLQHHSSYFKDTKPLTKNIKITYEDVIHNYNLELKASQKKMFYIYKTDNSITILNNNFIPKKKILTNKKCIIIQPLDEKTFFAGFLFGGGIIYNTEGEIIESFLPNESISRFLIDHEGGYWFSTLHSGVIYIKEPKVKSLAINDNFFPINCIEKDNLNNLYIGSELGDIYKITKKKKHLSP